MAATTSAAAFATTSATTVTPSATSQIHDAVTAVAEAKTLRECADPWLLMSNGLCDIAPWQLDARTTDAVICLGRILSHCQNMEVERADSVYATLVKQATMMMNTMNVVDIYKISMNCPGQSGDGDIPGFVPHYSLFGFLCLFVLEVCVCVYVIFI